MSAASYALQRIIDRTGKPVTGLADEAGIDRGGLSRVLNAKDGARLSEKMLEKLLRLECVSEEDRVELVMGYLNDVLPVKAKGLVVVLRKPQDSGAVLREDPPLDSADTLTQALATVGAKARANPALARMVRNLAVIISGDVSPTL